MSEYPQNDPVDNSNPAEPGDFSALGCASIPDGLREPIDPFAVALSRRALITALFAAALPHPTEDSRGSTTQRL